MGGPVRLNVVVALLATSFINLILLTQDHRSCKAKPRRHHVGGNPNGRIALFLGGHDAKKRRGFSKTRKRLLDQLEQVQRVPRESRSAG